MGKFVLVLGAGRAQVPLMNYARTLGYGVIAVSPAGSYDGRSAADKVIDCDVSDYSRIYELVKSEPIAAVVSEELDVAVPSVAWLADRLGLRGNPIGIARKFKNKYEMRKAASELGVNVPGFAQAGSVAELERAVEGLRFPLMIKPVDYSSSKGVRKVYDLAQMKSAFADAAQYSREGVIVEEFVHGREYIVEAYTHGNRTTNLVVGNSEYFNVRDTFIPRARIFRDATSAVDPIESRLRKINCTIAEGFGLEFGVTHGEYLYDQAEDKIYLVEIAARGGGVNIASRLIPAITGLNVSELVVRDALGLALPELKLNKGAAAYVTLLLPEGVVTDVVGADAVKGIDGVIACNLDGIRVGDRMFSVTDKRSRKGPILISAETKARCQEIADEVRSRFRVTVKTKTGELREIWE